MSEEQSDVILQPSLVQTQDLGKETVINYLYRLPETNCNQPPDSRHHLAPIIIPPPENIKALLSRASWCRAYIPYIMLTFTKGSATDHQRHIRLPKNTKKHVAGH